MTLFHHQRPRVPHDEAGFVDDDYTAEYSWQTGKHSGADFQLLIKYALNHLNERRHARVLEIGSGPGWIGIRLAQRHSGVHVTGIDLSESFISLANQNKVDSGVARQVDFQYGDATSMVDFSDGLFDAVVSNQSLHYWDPPQIVFNQVARVLKPNAIFCIADDRRDLTWLGKMGVGIGMLFHSRRIRESWRHSLAGCFTPNEVEQMLEGSALRNCWTMQVGARIMMITGQLKSPR